MQSVDPHTVNHAVFDCPRYTAARAANTCAATFPRDHKSPLQATIPEGPGMSGPSFF
jgi:hypothetical protein